jgi:hypothetical protein
MQQDTLQFIDDINARQDEVLEQIDQLNAQIDSLINLCMATVRAETESENRPQGEADQNCADSCDVADDDDYEQRAAA